MICLAAFFIFGFATTWGKHSVQTCKSNVLTLLLSGPMIWTICGELYPSRYRAKGMALATASNWLWNFLLGKAD